MARLVELGLFLLVLGTMVALALYLAPGADDSEQAPTLTAGSSWPDGAVAVIPPAPLPVPAVSPTGTGDSSGSGPAWSPGDYTVVAEEPVDPNGEIGPGLYASSANAAGCTYELAATNSVVGEEALGEGRLLVSIEAEDADQFSSSPGCGQWRPWTVPAVPSTEAGNGDYWGGDLAPGEWDLPEGCRWEDVTAFRGVGLDDLSGSTIGPAQVTVDENTQGVRLRGCNQPAVRSEV